ncbi:ATP-binding response regulator [Lignipirellula cremea]|uniref:Transcriptional regulatory protein ZraR n=1 Tax=Lignipirellula cremea TaxID=2528010 RepID=A0A518DXC3_9BACT|nr:response regulator [Lignipirellula cremea]QDU96477.1 Transcriptional regulatory protein ZraR [Lignipirellula cremea]
MTSKRAKILVVDDTHMARIQVGGLLAVCANWETVFAKDGQEALECIAADHFDLVLTDLVMPVMGGLELVERIKKLHPQMPVILMTSQGNEHIASDALRAGAASYIPKRMLGDNLVSTVRSVLDVCHERTSYSRIGPYLRSNRLQFVIGNDGGLISPLVHVLQEQMLNEAIVDESERIRVAIALEEALSNALYHGNLELSSELRESENDLYFEVAQQRRQIAPYLGRSILIEAIRNQEEVRIMIRDEGPGFDPTNLPDPTDPENLEKVHGRGLLLIRTFMDKVIHNDRGNEITLVKRTCAEPVEVDQSN